MVQAEKGMDINDATWAIMREMSKLPYNVDDQQITRAKNQLKAQLLFAQDSPSGELFVSQPLAKSFRNLRQ